jgi:transcriptional regulator with XRE-family HTH domain
LHILPEVTSLNRETLTVPQKTSFGTYLRKARQKQKLRVRDVAAQMDVSDAAVYRWELDNRRPKDANLTALCKVLKLPVRATKAMAAG